MNKLITWGGGNIVGPQGLHSWSKVNLVPRAFSRFRGSGTGSKGPGIHWSRVSKNIGHFCNLDLLKSCHLGGGDEELNIAIGELNFKNT
jgi:hypothetical protein